MLNEQGGVIDDLIVYYLRDNFYRVVINSATREKDLAWLARQAEAYSDLNTRFRDDVAMIAVQGPHAIEKSIPLFDEHQQLALAKLARFQGAEFDDCFVARTGYTGEDGFEILMLSDQIVDLWDRLLVAGVVPCGLGARDTLRLEAGMNLYGSDMDETTSPLVSGLGWTVAMADERAFIGRPALEAQKAFADAMLGLASSEAGKAVMQLAMTATPQGKVATVLGGLMNASKGGGDAEDPVNTGVQGDP
jgi:aminomethyltransferase